MSDQFSQSMSLSADQQTPAAATTRQPRLRLHRSTTDNSKQIALPPKVITRQTTMNIGTIGHLMHGKSTNVQASSGVQTIRSRDELERTLVISLERLSPKTIHTLTTDTQALQDYMQKNAERNKVPSRSTAPVNEEMACSSKRSNKIFLHDERQHQNLRTPGKAVTERNRGNPKKQVKIENVFQSPTQIAPVKSVTIANGCTPANVKRTQVRQEPQQNEPSKATKRLPMKTVQVATVTRPALCDRNAILTHREAMAKNRDGSSNAECSRAAKGKENLSPGVQRPPSENGNSPEEQYIVEEILDVQIINNEPSFYIKWENYGHHLNTWESLKNVRSCSLLDDFLSEAIKDDRVWCTIEAIRQLVRGSRRYRQALTQHQSRLKRENEIISEHAQYDFKQLQSDLLLMAKLWMNHSNNKQIGKRITQAMCWEPSFFRREEQLAHLKAFEIQINFFEKTLRVAVVNDIDLEPPPTNFSYVVTNFGADGIIIPNDPTSGCECSQCHTKANCCGRLGGGHFAYNLNGRLRLNLGEAIYECNKLCKCGAECPNRVVQKGSSCNLTLFKTADGRGWGVRTEDIIRKGQYISEYCGQVVTREESDERHEMSNALGASFLFDLSANDGDCKYTIDATMFGNISRFYNHSCEPNCAFWFVWDDCPDPYLPRLALFALRKIEPGTELTFSYTRQMDGTCEKDARDIRELIKYMECTCGSSKCRKRVF